jgi:uncharacterized protein YaiE (UPF0345 family)
MNSRNQWTIGRMFLWVLVSALVFSHLISLYRSRVVGFSDFVVSSSELGAWMAELDPTTVIYSISGSYGNDGKESVADMTYAISAQSATPEQMKAQLDNCIRTKAESEGWRIYQAGSQFNYAMSKGVSRFRIFWWQQEQTSHDNLFAGKGNQVLRIKLLLVGYRCE